jgi:phage head maturation protease
MSERDTEIRTAAHAVELRASEDGSGIGQLTGYAAVFNRHSQNLGGFVETIDPGAFTKSIADAVPVMARMNHDDAHLLGTTWAGTLTLEAKVLAERGDMKWSSFAFRTIEDAWSQTEQGFPLRTLRAVQLVDVAPVNSPAYLDTTVGLRSLADHQTTEAPAPVPVPEGSGDPHPTATVRALRLDLDALR